MMAAKQKHDAADTVERMVAEAAALAQDACPAFAFDRLTAEHRAVLRDSVGFGCKKGVGVSRAAMLVYPNAAAVPVLFIGEHFWSDAVQRAFLELREAGRILIGGSGPLVEAAAHVFALLGILNQQDWNEGGIDWMADVVSRLEPVEPAWFVEWLPDLLRMMNAVRRQLPAPDDADEHPDALLCLGLTGAALAYEVGVRARRKGEYARALRWFVRASELGEVAADWENMVRGVLGQGTTAILRGNGPEARKAFAQAAALSAEHGLRQYEGEAYHNSLVLAGKARDTPEVLKLARLARAAYGEDRAHLLRLSADLGSAWLDAGMHHAALAVLEVLEAESASLPAEVALAVQCNTAAAAAAVGYFGRYESASGAALRFIETGRGGEHVSAALLALAEAAAAAGYRPRARALADRARDRGGRLGETEVQYKAEALLAELDSGPMARPEFGVDLVWSAEIGLADELRAALTS